MIASPLLRKSATIAYTGVRLPLAAVENRLPQSSRVRAGLQIAIRTIDSSMAPLLKPPADESAAPGDPAAGDSAGPGEPAAAPDREAEREAIAEAVRERQPDVGELADPNLDVAEVQAELQAKHALEARDESR